MSPASTQETTTASAKTSKKVTQSSVEKGERIKKAKKAKPLASKAKTSSSVKVSAKTKKSVSKIKSSNNTKSIANKPKGKSTSQSKKINDKKIISAEQSKAFSSDIQENNDFNEESLSVINTINNESEEKLEDTLLPSGAMSEEEIRAKALASIKLGPKGVYTEDSIRVYLQEIGRIRLLRPDEEIELARKIADLLHLEEEAEQFESENGHYPTTKEWAALQGMPVVKFRRRLMLGRRAKEKMVQSNLRLVVSIAKKYMNRGLSFQDLIQEGSLGLIRAAEKFDHEKGYKFSTYATWWIRQAITRAIADQSRTIRLPVHLYETISRIKKTTKVLSQEFGRKPTEEEIAESMEMTIEKLRFIAKSAQLPISLETPIGKEEDSRLGDFIEADIENPEQDVAKNLLREDLEGVLATLSPRERDVLRLRYGLDDGRMKTLEEIGQIFDVTRERIRQIEAKALRKLRHPNRNGVLKEYIK